MARSCGMHAGLSDAERRLPVQMSYPNHSRYLLYSFLSIHSIAAALYTHTRQRSELRSKRRSQNYVLGTSERLPRLSLGPQA